MFPFALADDWLEAGKAEIILPPKHGCDMTDTAQLMWSMLFGAVGMGLFIYGKKQRAAIPLLAGMALLVFPYFVSNLYLLLIIGAALTALPFFVRL